MARSDVELACIGSIRGRRQWKHSRSLMTGAALREIHCNKADGFRYAPVILPDAQQAGDRFARQEHRAHHQVPDAPGYIIYLPPGKGAGYACGVAHCPEERLHLTLDVRCHTRHFER